MMIIIAAIVSSLLVGMKFARYITKSFTKPLEIVKKASTKLSKGEFDIEISAKGHDEFAEMERYFQDAVNNLRHTIEEIIRCLDTIAVGDLSLESPKTFKGEFIEVAAAMEKIIGSLNKAMAESYEASKQVALGSVQLAEGAQSLAEGATDQASSIQDLQQTIDAVSATIENSAENALNSYNKTQQYEVEAQNGNIEMQQLKDAMEQITNTSHEIAAIAEQIEDIASQTNLLSLNASIEAARAGEAGRGFAVVAEQIGILATDSAKSAVTTKELIVNALSEIEKGNAKMTTAAASFEHIMSGMRDMAFMAKENADSSRNQAEAMRQIKGAAEQISSVIQSNAAVAEENSATSEEMAAQSETVQEIIKRFKLKESLG